MRVRTKIAMAIIVPVIALSGNVIIDHRDNPTRVLNSSSHYVPCSETIGSSGPIQKPNCGGISFSGASSAEMRFNSLGIRHQEPEKKTPNVYRVLLLGDSIVLGAGLSPSKTLPALITLMMKGKLPNGKTLEVINAGFKGRCPGGSVQDLNRLAKEYQPDYIVEYFGNRCLLSEVNDFVKNNARVSWLDKFLFLLRQEPRNARSADLALSDSQTKNRLKWLGETLILSTYSAWSFRFSTHSPIHPFQVAVEHRRDLHGIALQRGVPFLSVITSFLRAKHDRSAVIVNSPEWAFPFFDFLFRTFVLRIELNDSEYFSRLREAGIPFVTIPEIMDSDMNGTGNHPNEPYLDRVAERISKAIFEEIKRPMVTKSLPVAR